MPKRSRSVSPPPATRPNAPHRPRHTSPIEGVGHILKYLRKSVSPVVESKESARTDLQSMQCTLPPHAPLILSSPAEFDAHYEKEHTNRCSACGVSLPSAWFLELHLSEKHDPLVVGLREKGEKTVTTPVFIHAIMTYGYYSTGVLFLLVTEFARRPLSVVYI